MAADYEDFDDKRVKHLEMIQAVIGRLGTDSFLMKGWAVTVAGVFLGFAVNKKNGDLAFASLLPTIFFWGLDMYFLRAERLFRALHDQVRTAGGIEPFFMGATTPAFVQRLKADGGRVPSHLGTLFSATLLTFYGGLVVAALAAGAAV